MLWKRVKVRDQERILIAKDGRFECILSPGNHILFNAPGVSLELETFNVRDLVFQSTWADYLIEERPDVVDRHFTLVETNDVQVALVYADSQLIRVMTPAKRMLFWRGPAQVTAELVDVVAEPADALEQFALVT